MAKKPSRFKPYKDKAKEHRWRLVAPNGRIIAESGEGFKTRAGCIRSIDLVAREVPRAKRPTK